MIDLSSQSANMKIKLIIAYINSVKIFHYKKFISTTSEFLLFEILYILDMGGQIL